MAPNTRTTKRKSYSTETEAGRRNRLQSERRGEPSRQAEEAVQPPVDTPVPPPIVDENLNLPIVIYSPPSYKRYMVEENPMHEPVVQEEEEAVPAKEEEAVPWEEQAEKGDEVVGIEEEEVRAVASEEQPKEVEEQEKEEEEKGVEEQEEQQREVEGEGENEFVQAENEVRTAGEGDPGEENSRTVSDAREVKFN